MARVEIWGSMSAATDNQTQLEIDAETIGDLLDTLAQTYPGLIPQIERGVSVAVDGEIYRESIIAPIKPDSEVFIMPRLTGG